MKPDFKKVLSAVVFGAVLLGAAACNSGAPAAQATAAAYSTTTAAAETTPTAAETTTTAAETTTTAAETTATEAETTTADEETEEEEPETSFTGIFYTPEDGFTPGVYRALNDEYEGSSYFYIRSNGTGGGILSQSEGIGVPFVYECDGNNVMFHMAAADDNTPAEVTEVGDDGTITLVFHYTNYVDGSVNDVANHLTYISDDPDNFVFYSSRDLMEMARAYYKNLTGVYMWEADCQEEEDHTISLHLYEFVEDHNSTAAWYFVDPLTGKGVDLLDNPVDLTEALPLLETPDDGVVRPKPWNPTVEQRQVMADDNDFFGVCYIGWIDPVVDRMDDYYGYVYHILEETGMTEEFAFIENMPTDRFVSSESGQEFYLVIPPELNGVTEVYSCSLSDSGELVEGDLLYTAEGSPFLLKCNVSEIYPDVCVHFTDTNGETTEWHPSISGDDGHVITTNTAEKNAHDFTRYDNLSSPERTPLN